MSEHWTKELKVGDKVIYHYGGFGGNKKVATVKRITPGGFLEIEGQLFNEEHPRGGFKYSRSMISKWDEETGAKIEQEYNISTKSCFIKDNIAIAVKTMDMPTLDSIVALIKKEQGK